MENLHIGICHTKTGLPAKNVYAAWESSALKHGDTYAHIYSISDLVKEKPDVLICLSYPQFDNRTEVLIHEHTNLENRPPNFPSPVSEFRRQVIKYANENKIRMIFIDSGVIGCSRNRDGNPYEYYQVGYDCIKGLGAYYNEGMPSDRFEKLNVEVNDWRDPNNHVLLFGQLRFGIGSQFVDIFAWYRQCLRILSSQGFRTYYLEHPNVLEPFRHEKFKTVIINKRECKYENDIGVAITFSTNACVDAILNGIPTICCSRLSPAYKVCSNSLEDLKNPKTFDRQAFLNDIAYTQWQTQEMTSGDCWEHLRKYAKDEPTDIYPKVAVKRTPQ